MYVLFWNQLTKVFVLRGVKSSSSYDLPENGDESYTVIDDSVYGLLDAYALIVKYAQESGWRNYTISLEDCK